MQSVGLHHIVNGRPDELTCKRFGEYLKNSQRKKAHAQEVRLFFDQLPRLLLMLYHWLDMPMPGPNASMAIALHHIFGPSGDFLQMVAKPCIAAPSFGFPIHRLPHYLVQELMAGANRPLSWIGQTGDTSVSYDPAMRALMFQRPLEYFLCTFVAFLVRDKSDEAYHIGVNAAPRSAFGALPAMSMRVPGGASRGALAGEPFGAHYIYEVLLLDYLKAFAPRSRQYGSVSGSTHPTTGAIFFHLLNDLWFRNEKMRDRISPQFLSALQLAAVYFLAACPAAQDASRFGASPHGNITREVDLFMPHLATLLSASLSRPADPNRHEDSFIMLVHLWLVVIQPWKAHGVYDKLAAARNPPASKSASDSAAPIPGYNAPLRGERPQADVLLLGLGHSGALAVELSKARGCAFREAFAPFVAQYRHLYALLRQVFRHSTMKALIGDLLDVAPLGDQFSFSAASPLLPFAHLATLCQVMICFTDAQLLRVLCESQPPVEEKKWSMWEVGRSGANAHATLFVGGSSALDLEVVEGGRRLWHALQASVANARCPTELSDGVAFVGRRLTEAAAWRNLRLEESLAAWDERASDAAANCGPELAPMADNGAGVSAAPVARSAQPIRYPDGRLTPFGRERVRRGLDEYHGVVPPNTASEWSKPVRSSELLPLVKLMQALAWLLDALRGTARRDALPDTEWPRLMASKKIAAFVTLVVMYKLWGR